MPSVQGRKALSDVVCNYLLAALGVVTTLYVHCQPASAMVAFTQTRFSLVYQRGTKSRFSLIADK